VQLQPTNDFNQPKNDEEPRTVVLSNDRKVIRPVSDMSDYVRQETPEPTAPDQSQSSASTVLSKSPSVPVRSSGIYPEVAPHVAPTAPSTAQPHPVAITSNTKVVTRIPLVRVYALVIIVYGLYSALALSSLLFFTRGAQILVSPALFLVYGLILLRISVGVYLLMAKNSKAVSGLLMALLIVDGLMLLNTLVSTVRSIAYIRLSTLVSLLISIGLYVFLWNVKSKVDAAATE